MMIFFTQKYTKISKKVLTYIKLYTIIHLETNKITF